MHHEHHIILDLVRQHALQFGDFTLASGKKASFYLDCRRLTLDSRGASVIANGLLNLCGPDFPAAVGGMELGAVPITAAMLCVAHDRKLPLRGFVVRKERKEHGKGQQIEGPVKPGDEVVIVEDVVTTGGSSLKAIEACREFGLKVSRVVAIVDRQAGGTEAFRAVGCEFQSLLTLADLGL
jgi:orotate phosphoribosyltransferase